MSTNFGEQARWVGRVPPGIRVLQPTISGSQNQASSTPTHSVLSVVIKLEVYYVEWEAVSQPDQVV